MIWGSAGFIIGIVLGSFTKALADRSLVQKSFWGRSYCVQCKKRLRWYDLFPIVSYLSTAGKCRYCHKKISIEYLVVEIVMGVLIAFLFFQTFFNFKFVLPQAVSFETIFNLNSNFKFIILILDTIFKTFFISILAALFLTDLKKMLIPDRIVIPAIYISLIYLVGNTAFKIGYLWVMLLNIGMGVLIAGFFSALIIITKGKGMGGGDVKLGALIGLALGFPNALIALMLAFLSGAVISLGLIFSGKKHLGQVIPFGPFLVLGSLVALFWGNQIIKWYLKVGS